MSKILLVYDDFAELNATELSLKKCSFDVIGLTNEYTVKDQIVSFNPDILVGFGNTQRVSSLSVGKKIKEMGRWTGKSILLFPKSYELTAEDLLQMRMDMLLETPVSVIRLIQIICKLLKHDEKAAIEKLAKSFAIDKHNTMAFASYDAETVKAIQHIQGELEKFESNTVDDALPVTADEKTNVSASSGSAPIASSNVLEELSSKNTKIDNKKRFFENEETTKTSEDSDPFAALISELKGEPTPEVSRAPQSKGAIKLDDDSMNLDLVGQQIRTEIADHAETLAGKMKKYAELTVDLHLYPESTIKKTKAKKQLNELKKDWNPDELRTQDQFRREFVEQLFKETKKKN